MWNAQRSFDAFSIYFYTSIYFLYTIIGAKNGLNAVSHIRSQSDLCCAALFILSDLTNRIVHKADTFPDNP